MVGCTVLGVFFNHPSNALELVDALLPPRCTFRSPNVRRGPLLESWDIEFSTEV